MTLDIAKSFTYMFEDPDWVRKLAIGAAAMLLGIVFTVALVGLIPLMIVTGYTLDVVRNVMDGRQRPLPEWEDWGRLFVRGLKLTVVFLIWLVPLFIALVPWGIGSALVDNQGAGVSVLGSFFMICGGCLSMVWALVVLLFTPALYLRLARTDDIASGFDFPRLWAITRDNLTNVIVAIIMTLLASVVAGIAALAGLVAVCIGIVVTVPLAAFWQVLVDAHLYGQVGATSTTTV